MSRIEGEFLSLALEIGLAQAIADTLRDIDRSIAEMPASHLSTRYRQRLEHQRASLRQPTLRTTAALVVAICAKDPGCAPRIRRAFAKLVEAHPDLAWFYTQLPEAQALTEPLRRVG